MSFIYGTELAVLQDKLFYLYYIKGRKISKKTKKRVKKNIWIGFSKRLAPNNLVLRNYILVDLMYSKCSNISTIIRLLNTISGSNEDHNRIWIEGYSYWLYTIPFLIEYIKKFSGKLDKRKNQKLEVIKSAIDSISRNFVLLSYEKDGKRWPPPYGDLRQIPITQKTYKEEYERKNRVQIGPITYQSINRYVCRPHPLGLNGHAPDKGAIYKINKYGIPINIDTLEPFKWYEGYDKKYPDRKSELKDLLTKRRIFSILSVI